VVLWGPILVAVPGAGGGKWIVVGGYSVGRGGARGFFFVAMLTRTGGKEFSRITDPICFSDTGDEMLPGSGWF
jgi:hypothetical protein